MLRKPLSVVLLLLFFRGSRPLLATSLGARTVLLALIFLLLAVPLAAQTPRIVIAPTEIGECTQAGYDIWASAVIPDIDGDGVDDIAVAANADGSRIAVLHSGRTNERLTTFATGGIIRRLTVGPDVDGDEKPDLLALAGNSRDVVLVAFSTTTGGALLTYPVTGTEAFGSFRDVATVPDLDDDGVADVVAAVRSGVQVFSGASGAQLLAVDLPGGDPEDSQTWVELLLPLPDVDGDDMSDLLATVSDVETAPGGPYGRAFVFSLQDGPGGEIRERLLLDLPHPASEHGPVPGLEGVSVGRWFGESAAVAPDRDGDGFEDLALRLGYHYRHPDKDLFEYRMQVVIVSSVTGALLDTLVDPDIEGYDEPEQGEFGMSLVTLPDLDGDGASDLLAAFPDAVFGGNELFGRSFVLSSANGDVLGSIQSLWSPVYFGQWQGLVPDGVTGPEVAIEYDCGVALYPLTVVDSRPSGVEQAADQAVSLLTDAPFETGRGRFGRRLSSVPDIDGDGVGDIAASEWVETVGSATVLLSGATGAPIRRIAHRYQQDSDVTVVPDVGGVPDLDGDGRGDIIVGSPGDRARVFSGATGDSLYTVAGTDANRFVAGVGDVDGDGAGDLVLASLDRFDPPLKLASGASGQTLHLVGQAPSEVWNFGASVTGLPDVTGDGIPDVAVGATNDIAINDTQNNLFSDRLGRTYVYSGANGSLVRTLTAPTPAEFDRFGFALAAVPDTDDDGIADVLVGACTAPAGGVEGAGAVHMFSGATGALIRTFESPRPQAGGGFGCSVAGAELDGDGVGDAVIGAPREDAAGRRQAGLVYGFSGADGSLLATWRSADPEAVGAFGMALAVVPKTSRDVVVISAPGERRTAGTVYFTTVAPVAVEAGPEARGVSLSAWPNPTADRLTVTFGLAASADVRISVYNVLGREIALLHDGPLKAGEHTLRLDASLLPAGVYLIRAIAPTGTNSQGVTVVR